jgi:N4-(beta-N-acetylglucosaminyl)-L-asparaginase
MVVEMMRQGKTPEQACKAVVERIIASQKKRGKNPLEIQIGFLALNRHGEYGAYALQEGFEYAVRSKEVPNELFCAANIM